MKDIANDVHLTGLTGDIREREGRKMIRDRMV